MKVFLIDTGICNGCYCCQIACKDEHVSNDWTPYAKPQPETGQFWLKLNEKVRGAVPKVKVAYTPKLCNHCEKAPCMAACPVNGAIYKRKDGLVVIDPVKCTGCKNCLDACPWKVIYYNEGLQIAQKCTGCAHLLDSGWKEPRCVDACPTEALKFVEETDAQEFIRKAEILNPEYQAGNRVYYQNLPLRFVAGTVYDPAEKEVVIGALCTLSQIGSGIQQTVATDNYGDFWFEKLAVSRFNLKIEKAGKIKEFKAINTAEDVNLGDIPLT